MREGATNVIRHSRRQRAAWCQVTRRADGDGQVEVVDDGVQRLTARSGDARRGGHGLAGLRERAEALRGRLEAGPLPGGGFRLAVSVPVAVPRRARSGDARIWLGAADGWRDFRATRGHMIRVLIAEDQGMVRGALASLLALEPDIEVVAQVSRATRSSRRRSAAEPDVALLDIEMPGATGLEASEQLRAELPDVQRPDPDHVRAPRLPAPRDGGRRRRASCSRTRPAGELAAAIRRAVAGERIVDPGLAAAALSQGESPLTPREHEVLAASRDHATVAELAGALYLSPGTVRNHLSSVMQKLDARNRAEAVRVAEERGWL